MSYLDNKSPSRVSSSSTRTYQSPDGVTHTTVTTTKRSVLTSSSEESSKPSSTVKGDDRYFQHALGEMSKYAGSEDPEEGKVRKAMEKLTRERLAKAADSVGDDDIAKNLRSIAQSRVLARSEKGTEQEPTTPTTQSQTWVKKETLRQTPDVKVTPAPKQFATTSAPKPKPQPTEQVTTRRTISSTSSSKPVAPLSTIRPRTSPASSVWKSMDSHEHLLKKFEEKTAALDRASGFVPREEQFNNYAQDIIKEHSGEDALNKRLEKQKKVFQAGAKKGNLFEEVPLFFKKTGIKALFEKRVKSTNQRATHSEGVGAVGYAVVIDNNKIPKNDFFVPKKMFEVRARHANFPTIKDDSRPAWRSLALKFQDHDYDSPLDLLLQTGRSTPFFNTNAIDEFYTAIVKGETAFKEYVTSMPVYLETILEGMRQDIDSYTHVHYHSQMTFDFKALDNKRRVARIRVIPADGYPDLGHLRAEEQKELWGQLLSKEELEKSDTKLYLEDEFVQRIQDLGVSYNLQIQIHEWQDEKDTNMLYNPAMIWEEKDYPWLDLVKIRLLTVLPDDVTEITRFNVANLPWDTLSYPDATSADDFNVVPHIRKDIYETCSKLRGNQPPPPVHDDAVEYLIHIATGNQDRAGLTQDKCNIYICLIGTESRTGFIRLHKKTKNDFNKGVRSTFALKEKYVGDIQCVKVYKDKKGVKTEWFLEYLIVSTTYNKTCYRLPCYRWFSDKTPLHILRDDAPTLYEKESNYYMKRQRQAEIMIRQNAFRWRDQELDPHFQGLPGYIAAGDNVNELPGDLKSDAVHKLAIDWGKHIEARNNPMQKVRNLVKPRVKKGKLVDEAVAEELVDKHPDSKSAEMLQYIIQHWRSDLEFGRQMLNGVMPLKVSRLRDIPKVIPLKDEMVQGLLDGTRTLRDELDDGHLFLVTFPELERFAEEQLKENEKNEKKSDVTKSVESQKSVESPKSVIKPRSDIEEKQPESPKSPNSDEKKLLDRFMTATTNATNKIQQQVVKKDKKYMCAPMVILYLKGGVALLPLAIQLTQQPADDPVIYTPNDDAGEYSDWLLAKMWVRVAETNMHHFAARILGTLLLLEPVSIAVIRNLPAIHPISKLLSPYLKNLVGINTIYRKYVISDGGALAEVLALGDKGVTLMKRQLGKFKKFSALYLPDNFGNRGVLDTSHLPGYFYRDDSLMLWEAIRDFVIDIICVFYDDDDQVASDEEIGVVLDDLAKNGYHGQVDLPKKFSTIEELVQFCTTIIFRISVQYTALSRGMDDAYSYCLNAPPCLMLPPPTEKRPFGYTAEYLHSLLPSSDLQDRYTDTVTLMTQAFKKLTTSLGQYPEAVFTDEKSVIAIKSFQKQLSEINDQIVHRRKELEDWNYDYLSPSNIPVGIVG